MDPEGFNKMPVIEKGANLPPPDGEVEKTLQDLQKQFPDLAKIEGTEL